MLTPKLRNLSLLALSALYFLVRGKADKKIGPPQKILIIQLAKLGDMGSTTPMFRAVKEKYPKAELYVSGDKVNQELLSDNRDVDHYIIWSKKIEERFDAAFLTGPGPEALAKLYLSGIPLIVAPTMVGGFTPLAAKSYRLLTKLVETRPHYLGRYAPREYLRLLEPIGIFTDDTKKHLAFSKKAEEKILNFFQQSNIQPARPAGGPPTSLMVGIFPSTGHKIKLWGRDKFAKVADWLSLKHGAKIVLFGSASDQREAEEFLTFVGRGTRIINTCGAFNVDELKAAISKMSLFVSADSGPIYIAEAFDVPTVDILGPMSETDQAPVGKRHKVVFAPRRKPELGVFNTRVYDEAEALRQSEDVTVEMVIQAAEELVRDLRLREKFG